MPEVIECDSNTIMITEEMPIPAEMQAEIDAAGGIDNYVIADELRHLREERNKRIAETDWMANSDVSMSDAWKTYRQSLRDITTTYTNIREVVWPVEPGS